MSAIDVVFCSVAGTDPRCYLEQKVKAMLGVPRTSAKSPKRNTASAKVIADHVARIFGGLTAGKQPIFPLHRTVDISRYSRSEREVLKRQRAWLLQQVDQRFPLLDGEHVEPNGDFLSYFTRAFLEYPKGTVVLRRTTNRSVIYYVMRDVQARPRQHRIVLVPHPPLARRRELRLASEPHWNDAARRMADGLAGLLPKPYNVLGTTLIALFWPSGSKATTDWTEVYRNMQAILKNGLAEHDVKEAATKVKGFTDFMNNEYVALKADPSKTPEELLTALSAYDTAFFLQIVNVFMYGEKENLDVASASLANFLLAANLHIALNQERALIDPSHKKDPKQSGYARTVANLASLYAAYVRATGPSVRELRMRQISTLKKREEVKPSAFGGCDALRYSWTFWFEDANKGYHSANYHYSDIAGQCDPIDYKKVRKKELDAQTALNEYVKKVGDEIDSYLESKVYGVADSWERLAKNPIPKLSD